METSHTTTIFSNRPSIQRARLAQWKSTSFTRKGSQVQILQRAPSRICLLEPSESPPQQVSRAFHCLPLPDLILPNVSRATSRAIEWLIIGSGYVFPSSTPHERRISC